MALQPRRIGLAGSEDLDFDVLDLARDKVTDAGELLAQVQELWGETWQTPALKFREPRAGLCRFSVIQRRDAGRR